MKLAHMLGQSEAAVSDAISHLEELAGWPSEDLRLLSENKRAIRQKIAQLGLDPNDTTSQELYFALYHKYGQDAARVDKAVGASDGDLDLRITKATELVRHIASAHESWVIKPSRTRSLLAANPPKKLMKLLGYRSSASMLKREDVDNLLLVAPLVESPSWQKTFQRAVAKLNSADYVLRPVSLVALPGKYKSVARPKNGVIANQYGGSAAIWPSVSLDKSPTLTLAIMLAGSVEQLGVKDGHQLLAKLHPALSWWADTKHLLSEHDGQAVSLNIADNALNHFNNYDYDNRLLHHGQQRLWRELANRYHRYTKQVGEALPEIEANFDAKVKSAVQVPMPMKLAAETVEA